MNELSISVITFFAIFLSSVGGITLAQRLPRPHRGEETRIAVSVSMAIVGTLTALMLSLMLNSANTAFHAREDAVETLAVSIVRLDHELMNYGSLAQPIRSELRRYAAVKVRQLSDSQSLGENSEALELVETIQGQVSDLPTASDHERRLVGQALDDVKAISDARWFLAEKTGSIEPSSLLILLIFWLALLFASFGLFAPRNGTVVIALLMCALAIAGGLFMILELGTPTSGLIRISVEPLRKAAEYLEIAGQGGPP
jgi:hypothetical protein